jgi:hypothetical protein
MFSIVNTAG